MKNISSVLTSIFIILFLNSCSDSSSTGSSVPAFPVLTAQQTSVTIAVNYSRTVAITGGNGRSSVLSISDSSVISAYVFEPYVIKGRTFQDVQIQSKKTGSATITVQDSAHSSKLTISVSVATMVTSPTAVKMRSGRNEYVSIMGGKKPYQVLTAPNSSVATVELTTYSSMYVYGMSQGTTSITIRDSSVPYDSIVVPVEVIADPKFIEQGSVSFTSTIGNFSATGVSVADLTIASLSGEGAGGWLNRSFYAGDFVTILAYRKIDLTKVDIIFITCMKGSLTTGTVAIDTSSDAVERAFVVFALNKDMNMVATDLYQLTSGSLMFSGLSENSAVGSFTGNGVLVKDEKFVPSSTVSVSGGVFNVPLLLQSDYEAPVTKEDRQLDRFLERFKEEGLRMMMKRAPVLSK